MVKNNVLIGILSIGMITSILCSDAMGVERSQDIFPNSEKGFVYNTHDISEDTLILDGKGKDYVLFCTRRFEITSNTIIKNEWGTLISLKELSIPCEAIVSYYNKPAEKNTYVALSIEIQGAPNPQPE